MPIPSTPVEPILENPIAVVASLATKAEIASQQAQTSEQACRECVETCEIIVKQIPNKIDESLGVLKKSVEALVLADQKRKEEEEAKSKQLQKYKTGALTVGSAVGGGVLANLPAIVEIIKGLMQ